MTLLAAIDGDILVYRAAFAAERTRYTVYETDEDGMPFGPTLWDGYGWADCKADLTERGYDVKELCVDREREYDAEGIAVNNLREMMKRIVLTLEDVDKKVECFVALSAGEETYRHALATTPYKHSRKDQPKPLHYQAVRNALINEYGAVEFRAIEADDAIAMLQLEDPDNTIIVSIDKDLLQVPGMHYHIVTGEVTTISQGEAYLNLWKQVLTGDKTDDIPGIFRVGEAKATKLLKETPPEFFEDVVLEEWAKYAKTDRYNEEWPGHMPTDAMLEVKALVTVGGDDARKALHEAEEELRQIPFRAGEGGMPKAGQG